MLNIFYILAYFSVSLL